MDIDAIKSKVTSQIIKYFKSEGYSRREIDDNQLFSINIADHQSEGYIDLYLYAEISLDEFFVMYESLDDAVIQFDPSAYFEPVQPGIYMCRIYEQDKPFESETLSNSDLTKIGNQIAYDMEDSYGSEFLLKESTIDSETNRYIIVLQSSEYGDDEHEVYASISVNTKFIASRQDFLDGYHDQIINALDNAIESNTRE